MRPDLIVPKSIKQYLVTKYPDVFQSVGVNALGTRHLHECDERCSHVR